MREWLFMRGMDAAERERLRALSGAFIARKKFAGTHGLEVSAQEARRPNW